MVKADLKRSEEVDSEQKKIIELTKIVQMKILCLD